jgi:uncharacterized damage-inducible protein DinB
MSVAEKFMPEFEQECANTRKILELIPDDKLGWKPHEKSMELGRLAWHASDLPQWCSDVLTKPGLSFTAADSEKYRDIWKGKTRADILARFDKDAVAAKAAITVTCDDAWHANWKMEWMGQTVIDLPRTAVYRTMVMNHMIHHRAQLGVYYRLLNIPIPGLYGPSADEMTGA